MIWTSYFARSGQDHRGISIAVSSPKDYKGTTFSMLVPPSRLVWGYKQLTITTEQYIEEYNKQLSKLNVKIVGGLCQRVVLLCWERPESFCHRHLVSEWLNKNGFECKEV